MDLIEAIEPVEQQAYFRKRLSLYTKEEKLFMKLLLPKDSKPLKEAQYLISALSKKPEES